MLDNLHNIILKQIENNQELINKLSLEIQSMESQKDSRLSEISQNNSNREAHQILSQIERELEKYKGFKIELEKQLTIISQHQDYFQNLKKINLTDNIQESLSLIREERDTLRTNLIPTFQTYLEELEAQKKKLDNLVLTLSNQLTNLDRQKDSSQNDDTNPGRIL